MAEPRPGSHTPPVPSTGWLPGRVKKSHKCRVCLGRAGSQTTIVEAAILRPSCFPRPALSTAVDRRATPTFLNNKGPSTAGVTGSNSGCCLGAPRCTALEASHLSLESASAVQAAPAALGAAILRLTSPSPLLSSSWTVVPQQTKRKAASNPRFPPYDSFPQDPLERAEVMPRSDNCTAEEAVTAGRSCFLPGSRHLV